MQVSLGAPKRQEEFQLVDITQELCLSQVVNIHASQNKTLDVLFTNSPFPVNQAKGMPSIRKADHDIVYDEYDIKVSDCTSLTSK